jgi:hypothetical protein
VEKILDSRQFGRRRQLQYLIKWEGYLDSENTWVDKDDVFADDKVREFKNLNPKSETHIRGTPSTKSPYLSTPTQSQLLYNHTLHSMSSDGNNDLAYEYPTGAVADSPVPFSQENSVNTPVTVPVPIVDFTTLQPLNVEAPVLILDLSLHPPQPLTLQPCSDSSESIPQPLSPPMASAPPTKPTKCLLFHSPLPKGEGIKQALAWNREQLLDLRRLWELHRQHQVEARLIPMTHPPMMISDAALAVGNSENIAMATPPLYPIPHLTSHLDSQCGGPFSPTAWQGLTSIMRRPQRWQVASSTPLKTTKMPLWFRHPMTTEGSSPASLPKDLGLKKPWLLKGWVYAAEDVSVKVEAKVADPHSYLNLDAPLTHLSADSS